MKRLGDFLLRYGVLLAVAVLVVYFKYATTAFWDLDNFLDILRASSILTIVALGVTFSVVVNGFDVSVGGVVGLVVMLATALMVIWHVPWYLAALAGLAVGVVAGLFNSFLIVKLKIPDLLATLGALYLLQGMQLAITKGDAVYKGMTNPWSPDRAQATGEIPGVFLYLGQGYAFASETFRGIPVPVLVMAAVAVLAWFFLDFTRWGRAMYAVGGNPEAARLAGLPVNRYRTAAYVISATLSALAGLVLAARLGSGTVGAGRDYLLDAVAATFVGFAVLAARRPNVWGTVLGAVFVGILLNGLTMLNMPFYIQDIVKGLVLIAALGISYAIRREGE